MLGRQAPRFGVRRQTWISYWWQVNVCRVLLRIEVQRRVPRLHLAQSALRVHKHGHIVRSEAVLDMLLGVDDSGRNARRSRINHPFPPGAHVGAANLIVRLPS
jgi:hypothetical protein